MLNKKVIRLALLLLVVAAVGGGIWWWQTPKPANPPGQLTLYGNVDIRQVELAFNSAERITRMFVQEGDQVMQGQRLATLETAKLAAKVARAEARVAAQQQVVARLEAGTRSEEIDKARAELALAEAQLQDAQRSYERVRNLAARKLASPQEVDDARAAADAAAARLRAAKATLELALAGPRREDIAAAKATLEAYQAEQTLARQELADASLYASAAGIIRDRILQPGDMASPQRPVYTLALTNPVWVRAYVDEPDLGKLYLGMQARVTTDSFPGKVYQGWLGYISPTAEFTPKSVQTEEVRTSLVYQARVYVCNPQNELRLGMPVTVTIPVPQSHGQTSTDENRCQKADVGAD